MLAYPVVTSGPLAHRGSFDALLGDRKADPEALDAVSIESISMRRRRRCSSGIPFLTIACRTRTR